MDFVPELDFDPSGVSFLGQVGHFFADLAGEGHTITVSHDRLTFILQFGHRFGLFRVRFVFGGQFGHRNMRFRARYMFFR